MLDGTEPITDDEVLYRRSNISLNYFDPESNEPISPKAFKPHRERDKTGLSVFRAKYINPSKLCDGGSGRRFWVISLRAGDLREHGIEVIPRPSEHALPGHAELPGLRADNRKETEELQLIIAEKLCIRIDGPYP